MALINTIFRFTNKTRVRLQGLCHQMAKEDMGYQTAQSDCYWYACLAKSLCLLKRKNIFFSLQNINTINKYNLGI